MARSPDLATSPTEGRQTAVSGDPRRTAVRGGTTKQTSPEVEVPETEDLTTPSGLCHRVDPVYVQWLGSMVGGGTKPSGAKRCNQSSCNRQGLDGPTHSPVPRKCGWPRPRADGDSQVSALGVGLPSGGPFPVRAPVIAPETYGWSTRSEGGRQLARPQPRQKPDRAAVPNMCWPCGSPVS